MSLSPIAEMLINDFSAALKDKLLDAQNKHGWSDDWLNIPDYQLHLDLKQHVEKGDPRDVAIYCAFAWYHGYRTA